MANVVTDLITKVRDGGNPVVTTVSSSRSPAGASLACDNLAHWPNETVHFMTYRKTANGAIDKATQLEFKGIVSGNTIGSVTLKQSPTGVDLGNTIGDFVQMAPTAAWGEDLYNALIAEHKVTGKHSAITADSITATAGTFDSITINGSGSTVGWSPLGATPSTITNNGNHSTDLTFTGVDLTPTISEGMRLRTTRTVPTQTQVTKLNGTTQYWNNTSPAGMTFTDDFVVTAKVKLSSYADAGIVSRYNGTSGWALFVNSSGQLNMVGYNGGAANYRLTICTQSLPLNKLVTVTAQLDMSSYPTLSSTTNYFMIDGVDVPATITQSGTNPNSLVQAGNLEIGSRNAAIPFPGKIAQVAIFNSKVTQATMRSYENQSFLGTEPNLISAWKFDGNGNSIGTSNNLTAQGGATATEPDSPFGNSGASADKEYAIVMSKPVYSGGDTTMTVQTPEGCAIPTSGGISSVDYSSASVPFGFPRDVGKWEISSTFNQSLTSPSLATNVWQATVGLSLPIPVGAWSRGYKGFLQQNAGGVASSQAMAVFEAITPANTTFSYDTVTSTYDSGSQFQGGQVQAEAPTRLSSQTTYNIYTVYTQGTATVTTIFRGDLAPTKIFARNAYL